MIDSIYARAWAETQGETIHTDDDDVAALSAAEQHADDGWMPIETAPAPIDGTKFDAWCVHPETNGLGVRIPNVQMRGDKTGFGFITHMVEGTHWEYLDQEGPIFPAWKMTHWRPLPAPPRDLITKGDVA